ncbi:AAA family ATPase [Kordiimonas aestuarii]|uniref:AAA family ATPase n=1 Tax=Kordiimonas aestuarii TaxID=1005925 RepID=UPI0021CEA3FA|nr:MoxR family ATPase [Kordiimonas aestuarii]
MDEQTVKSKISMLDYVLDEVGKVIVGQRDIVEELLISILAGGHCLLEGVPGLAKTLMVNTLAKTLELDFHRVQFTPDLMPSDIIGTEILEEDHSTGKRFFKFRKGPVFTNIMLADEINRTPPKTQAALLEAMQEHSVSYASQQYTLPRPFFVLATQNPVEQAGTYPLPEAQLDRFLMFIRVGYPTEQEEVEILNRTTGAYKAQLNTVLNGADIVALQELVTTVEISEDLLTYVARLVRATRPQESLVSMIRDYVRWGAGPRAGQALVKCAKAKALISGRYAVTLNDIRFVANAVLRHRILLSFQAEAEDIQVENVIAALFREVSEPKSSIG